MEVDLSTKVCDWRIIISPGCPYYEISYGVALTTFIISIIAAITATALFIWRRLVIKAPFWRKGTSRGFFATPVELSFIFAALYNWGRIIDRGIVLYDILLSVPPSVRFWLIETMYTSGFIFMVYFSLALLESVPDHFFENTKVRSSLRTLFRLGWFVIGISSLQPILYAVGGYLLLVDPYKNYVMETVLYSIWTLHCIFMFGAITYFGYLTMSNLQRLSKNATNSKQPGNKKFKRHLRDTLLQLRVILTGIVTIGIGMIFIDFSFAVGRHQIWGIPWLSIVYAVLYDTFPGFYILCLGLFLWAKEIYSFGRSKPSVKDGESSGKSNDQNESEIIIENFRKQSQILEEGS